jgi:hypothetical protein
LCPSRERSFRRNFKHFCTLKITTPCAQRSAECMTFSPTITLTLWVANAHRRSQDFWHGGAILQTFGVRVTALAALALPRTAIGRAAGGCRGIAPLARGHQNKIGKIVEISGAKSCILVRSRLGVRGPAWVEIVLANVDP